MFKTQPVVQITFKYCANKLCNLWEATSLKFSTPSAIQKYISPVPCISLISKASNSFVAARLLYVAAAVEEIHPMSLTTPHYCSFRACCYAFALYGSFSIHIKSVALNSCRNELITLTWYLQSHTELIERVNGKGG